MRAIEVLWGLGWVFAGAAAGMEPRMNVAENASAWSELVTRARDIREDYAEALEHDSATDREATAGLVLDAIELVKSEALDPSRWLPRLEAMRSDIERAAQPIDIDRACDAMIEEIVRTKHIASAPTEAPDLARARELFSTTCAACHGVDGRADVSLAAEMNPPPASFFENELMNNLTPFAAYQAITHGQHGTAMPSFELLSGRDRWSLAFYVLTLRHAECAGDDTHGVPIETLARGSDSELAAAYGEAALPCLRRALPKR